MQFAVTDLRAEIVKRAFDWTDVAFNSLDQILDSAIFGCIEQGAGRGAARFLDLADKPRKPFFVAAPRQDRMIAAGCKSCGGMSTDASTRTDDKEYGFL